MLQLLGGSLGILATGWVDHVSGTELRVYPLYFVPVSYVGWIAGERVAGVAAVAAALVWLVANQLAGLTFTTPEIWVVNTAMHAGSFVLVAVLLSRLRATLARERDLARTDALTGLFNARAFTEQAELAVATSRRYQRPLTLAYIDLDDFKAVNDSEGHAVGDAVLRRVGRALGAGFRDVDIVARLGGDEFVVLMPETTAEGAEQGLARLHHAVADALSDLAPSVGVSIGAVSFETMPPVLKKLVAEADSVMYAAKSAGKNRVVVHRGVDSP